MPVSISALRPVEMPTVASSRMPSARSCSASTAAACVNWA